MESVESKAVEIFIKSAIDQELVHKVIVTTLQIIPCENESINAINDNRRLPSLSKFLNRLISLLNLNNGILMSTIVYLNRLKVKLPTNCKGLPSTRHRILLSCLILSIKFNNDFSLKNYDWLKLTNKLFNLKDINLMERQLLFLLNWNLFINENELYVHFNKFLSPIKEKLMNSFRMKQYLNQQKRSDSQTRSSSPTPSPRASSPRTPTSLSPSSTASAGTPASAAKNPTPYSHPQASYQALQTQKPELMVITNRKTSTSSISSASSGVSPLDSPVHYRQHSQSSVESLDSIPLDSIPSHITKQAPGVNPIIELTALNEQYKLNQLLERFQSTI